MFIGDIKEILERLEQYITQAGGVFQYPICEAMIALRSDQGDDHLFLPFISVGIWQNLQPNIWFPTTVKLG